jgi:hypothetical protein
MVGAVLPKFVPVSVTVCVVLASKGALATPFTAIPVMVGAGGLRFTVAVLQLRDSVDTQALTTAVCALAILEGAVYRPVALMVPGPEAILQTTWSAGDQLVEKVSVCDCPRVTC